MADIRAFIAIDLAERARAATEAAVRALREQPGGDGVRWVRTEALHVTLRFLGNLDPQRVGALCHQVGREAAGLAPFVLELGALRAFPSPRRPRVLALGVEPAQPLQELAAAVERGVVAAGFPAETRPFRAHLTLGRLRGGRGPDLDPVPAPEASSPVNEVVLFQSHLGRGGSRYLPLERMPLGGEDSPRTHSQGEDHG